MPDDLAARLAAASARREQAGLQRRRTRWQPDAGRQLRDGQARCVDFCSNDYLGLARAPEMAAALAAAAGTHGSGSGAAALVSGYHPEHAALERELADYLERDAVLLMNSGYQANLAVTAALVGRGDRVIQDRLCHASLIDGARLSEATLRRYAHSDLRALERRLATQQGGESANDRLDLVVTDGVFSMDGDVAPLADMAGLCAGAGAVLMVDDAHGIGVMGPDGRGSVAAAGLGQDQVPVLVGTLGKAFGCAGAFVAGERALIEHLVNSARPYLFSTAMPPALAGAARQALAMIRSQPWRRERLDEHIARFREGARSRGIELLDSRTPIQPVPVGENQATLDFAARLKRAGFLVGAIRPPTVAAGTARLRVTLSSAHEPGQVDALLDALAAERP